MTEHPAKIGKLEVSEDQTTILKTLIDISRIITNSHDLAETLAHTVERVAESLAVDVCSIYIHDSQTNMLELAATQGLNRDAVGKVNMPVHEGLIGHVFEEKHHINLRDVKNHPRFKYFPAIDEERLSSFLGVPLIEFRNILGVLVVQNQADRLFTSEEETLLITIASQISGLVSKALLVARLQEESEHPQGIGAAERTEESFQLDGMPIAPGLALSRVVHLERHRIEEPEYASSLTPEEENTAFRDAIAESEREIIALIEEVGNRINEQEAAIFHAHLLFLEDRSFISKIDAAIGQGASAEWAVSHVVKDYLQAFAAIDDPYLKERAADLEDVGLRLLNHLGQHGRKRALLEQEGILVTEMLMPSDTAHLDPDRIKGIITSAGGYVSHAAILARSLRIPAVSGIENVPDLLREGEEVMIDGQTGRVFVNPNEGLVHEFERYEQSRGEYLTHLADLRDIPCRTACGIPLQLRANISLPHDLVDYREFGAEGIGLYRTEAFYLMRDQAPTVEELVEHYTQVMETAEGQPVVVRTLDLGGERSPAYLSFPAENNPSLGTRSIRYQLMNRQLLRDQIMATLKVAHLGDVGIAFPMISQLEELETVLTIFHGCRADFERSQGHPAPPVKIGMVFEVPSTYLLCEMFMEHVDFVSIGSNDLTQYLLAVDRNNPHVSHLYDPLEPSVLMMIKRLVDAANRAGKPVELTGELASDPDGCLVLVGLGLRELSMNPPLIPIMKDRIAQYTLKRMEQLADIALKSTSAINVRRNLQVFHHQDFHPP